MIETVKHGIVRVFLGLGIVFIVLARRIDKDYAEILMKQVTD